MNHQLYREVMAEIGFTEAEKASLIDRLQSEYLRRTAIRHRIMSKKLIAGLFASVVLVVSVSVGIGLFQRTSPTPQYPDGYRAIDINEVYENSAGDTVRLTEISLCDSISYQGIAYTDSFLVLTLDMNYQEYALNSKQVVLTYLLHEEWNVALLNAEMTSTISDIGVDGNAKNVSGEVYLVFTVPAELKDEYETTGQDTAYWGSEMKLTMNGINDKAYSETIFRIYYKDVVYTDCFSILHRNLI